MAEGDLPIELSAVRFSPDGENVIDGVDLRIDAGASTVILGANGAGKSVLMRLMHGLLEPTSGIIAWGGARLRPRGQAMVFQRPLMLRDSALANVEYGLKIAGVPRGERRQRAHAVLAAVGLAAMASRPARLLSGGEQQCLALARAWALRPRVLFLDEPTASLDPLATREVEAIVRAIGDGGVKLVLTTHNLAQARRLAGEVVFMERGRVIEQTPADEFFRRPRSAEADAFIKGETLWPQDA